jgi:hypothetical protein
VSREAELCSLWYESVRDLVFSAAPWASLTGFARLAVNASRDTTESWVVADPPPGWLYAFNLPSDYLRARFLASGNFFLPSTVNNTFIIAANEETPILTYTRQEINPAMWRDSGLEHAVIYALAAHIAKGLTGNDSDIQNMFSLSETKVMAARANNANTQQQPVEHIPEWIAARGQGLNTGTNRYFYPSADFNMNSAGPLG